MHLPIYGFIMKFHLKWIQHYCIKHSVSTVRDLFNTFPIKQLYIHKLSLNLVFIVFYTFLHLSTIFSFSNGH